MARAFAVLCCLWLTLLVRPASAWIETHVIASETRLVVDRSGKAEIEHRITLHTNGSERLRRWQLLGVDPDAQPLSSSFVVPEADALSSSLATALALRLTVAARASVDGEPQAADLTVEVDDPRGLRRGRYVAVVRYRTDLSAQGRIQPDGALLRLDWLGPAFADGLDNVRAVVALPSAPTQPRPALADEAPGDDASDPDQATMLFEVRRAGEHDEVELVRTYASAGEQARWAVRFDPRALLSAPVVLAPEPAPGALAPKAPEVRSLDRRVIALLAGLFVAYAFLVFAKSREVAKRARASGAEVPAALPLPGWLRAPAAGAALAGGVWLEFIASRPLGGACLIVLATLLAAHGSARVDPRSQLRGPGRWLAVSEAEALQPPPRERGVWLDLSSRAGKALFFAFGCAVGAGAWWLGRHDWLAGVLCALDGIALFAVFGTGRASCLPPDLAVEPARLLRKVAKRIRAIERAGELRIVPRIRIPHGQVDADELRLSVVPRLPLRGFGSIEIGTSYALGVGARVAFPEVLVRVVAGSPCDEALAPLSVFARVTPGRKPDERVLAFVPRLPSARHTAAIAAALAVRVLDREAARVPAPKRLSRPPGSRAA